MLTTSNNISLQMEVSDSTVSILPGAARIGNTIMKYDGTRMLFSQLTDFGGDSSKYQYSSLFLQNVGGIADASSITSTAVDSLSELQYPVLPYDSTNPYGAVYGLGIFTMYTSDGTAIDLISLDRAE